MRNETEATPDLATFSCCPAKQTRAKSNLLHDRLRFLIALHVPGGTIPASKASGIDPVIMIGGK